MTRSYPILAPLFSGKLSFDQCESLGTLEPDPPDDLPVRSAVPTLILASRFDLITTAEDGRLASRTLSRSFFFEAPRLGHWVSPVSGCARRIELSFLDAPTRQTRPVSAAPMCAGRFVDRLDRTDLWSSGASRRLLAVGATSARWQWAYHLLRFAPSRVSRLYDARPPGRDAVTDSAHAADIGIDIW